MRNFCPYRSFFLIGTPVVALVLTVLYLRTEPFQPWIWFWFAVFYFITTLGITAGYHRLFAHKSYEAHPVLKWFFALFGAAALQNSILVWARDHRVHHRFVDTDADPYNINRGFWYAHIGWMMLKESPRVDPKPYGRDLETDFVVQFQHRFYLPLAVIMCFVVPTLLGWLAGSALGGLAIIGFLRLVVVHHFTFFINSWCHMLGRQTYDLRQTARDSALLAVFTGGEGYHNFHHTFGNDYRNGVKRYHWDPTKWFINACSHMRLTWNLKRTSQKLILLKQLEADERRLKTLWNVSWPQAYEEKLRLLRTKMDSSYARLEQLKTEYRERKSEYRAAGQQKVEDIRRQIRLAREDFRLARRQWRRLTLQLATPMI